MMIRKFSLRLALAAVVLAAGVGVSAPAHAAGGAKHPHAQDWSWNGPFGTFDRSSLQRGFLVYKQVCSTCHGMRMLTYRNLGEQGGPFQAVAHKDWQKEGEEPKLGEPGHGKYIVNAIDNPWVKALAAGYEVSEIDNATGDTVTRKARPSDNFVYPYANEAQGKAANGGSYPPDLSVITKARHGGADYVYALLTGYGKEPPPGTEIVEGKHYNPYFKGGYIGMADQLSPIVEAGAITFEDGTQVTKQQLAKDVVTFLQWASDPKQEQRKSMGLQVMAYLLLLSGLLYLAYRQVWRDTKH
jgi:cytochrome c1